MVTRQEYFNFKMKKTFLQIESKVYPNYYS